MKSHSTKIVILLIICSLAVGASAGVTDLSIKKTANVSSVRPGDVFTYSLFSQNVTLYTANDVFIIDKLPNGLILQSWTVSERTPTGIFLEYLGSGTGVWRPYLSEDLDPPIWGIPTKYRLLDFDYVELEITVQLDPLYTGYQIINTARITTIDPEWNLDNNESTLVLPVVIPAPGAIVLGSIGVGLIGWLRRRRMI